MSEERLSEALRVDDPRGRLNRSPDAMLIRKVVLRVLEPIPESVYEGIKELDDAICAEAMASVEAYRQYLLNRENNGVQ